MESESGKKHKRENAQTVAPFPGRRVERLRVVLTWVINFFPPRVINNAREEKICCEYCSGDTNEKVLSKCCQMISNKQNHFRGSKSSKSSVCLSARQLCLRNNKLSCELWLMTKFLHNLDYLGKE